MLYLQNGAIIMDFLQQGHAKVITGFHKKIAVRFQKEVAAKRTHNIKKGGRQRSEYEIVLPRFAGISYQQYCL